MNTELMFSSKDETWATPIDFFNKLNSEFRFTLDPCCYPESAKCSKYYTPETNGLIQDWNREVVFMNPPYGPDILQWMKKAYEESLKGVLVACLIPARTDTKYFHEYVMKAAEIRFIKGRLKFGNSLNAAPFPSMLVIFDIYANRDYPLIRTYTRDPISIIEFITSPYITPIEFI